MRYRFHIFFYILIFGFSNAAFSYDDAFWQEIAKRPDVKITIENDIKTAHFSGGVTISDNGLGMDSSGKGAALCAWQIYVDIKNLLDLCYPSDESEFKQNINYAVDELNNFIAVNSLTPITKIEIEEQIKKKFLTLKEQKLKAYEGQLVQKCSSDPVMEFANQMKLSIPPEKFRESIKDMVSVPRPPVMNPCF